MNKSQVAAMALVCLLASCKAFEPESTQRKAFLSVGGTKVYDDEFIYVFNKNNFRESSATVEEMDEYLDLFINFKLKVREARVLGLQNTGEFMQEFSGYRDELAKPYLTESKVNDRLVQEAYERMKSEISASHILVRVTENASPSDTMKAYEKISGIRQKIVSGEDFNRMASEYSEDPSAPANEGRLGYFTALQMVYPFEEAAYKTDPGEISPIFRTSFGYHILKVHDRRPSRGKIKVSHLLIRSPEGIAAEDSIAAALKVRHIYDQLRQGGLWFDLCSQFSEDLSSRASGGALPWFGAGNMIPEFEEAAFAIDSIGGYSKPFKTAYGWHIIRLDDKKGLEPFEELSEALQNRVKSDSRSRLSHQALIERLKKENRFRENRSAVEALFKGADSAVAGNRLAPELAGEKKIFEMKDSVFTAAGFYEFVKNRGAVQVSPDQYRKLYQEYQEEQIINYEKDRLPEKNYDYKMLLQEYEEGILLFQLMDDKIWSKAVEDTAGLKAFFDQHREEYKYGERLEAAILNASSEEIRDRVITFLQKEYLPEPGLSDTLTLDPGTQQLSNTSAIALKKMSGFLAEDEKKKVLIESADQALTALAVDILSGEGVHEERIILDMEPAQDAGLAIIKTVTSSREVLEEHFNGGSALELNVEEGLFEKGEHELLDKVRWEPGVYEVNSGNRFYVVEVRATHHPAYKKLEDIRGIVISDYQNYLEKIWIDELKGKYPVTVNETERKKIFRKLTQI